MAKGHGEVRRSQIITTFGPGALMDLPNYSVIVGGLDNWQGEMREIEEGRLLSTLRNILEIPDLKLLEPPRDKDEFTKSAGIKVWEFPEWFVTQNVEKKKDSKIRTRYLVHMRALDKKKFPDPFDRTIKHKVVPVRFVRACRNGHIGDIDWAEFVHKGDDTKCKRQLFMEEKGTSGDLSEITIRCECGKRKSLLEASELDKKELGPCDGYRPWLGSYSNEKCGDFNRLLIRNASNAYFSQVMCVISIPEAEDELGNLIESLWADLSIVQTMADLESLFKYNSGVREAMKTFEVTSVFDAILAKRNDTGRKSSKPIKDAELETLLSSEDEFGDDRPSGKFFARNLPREKWDQPWMENIDNVVLVHRLREVSAQIGFTRLEASTPNISGELDLDMNVKRAELAREMNWVPAIENRGEGIFLSFNKLKIEEWCNKKEVVDREKILRSGFEKFALEKDVAMEFPGLPYYLLHSLSHLLINAVSLDCGYPASSIRERIYGSLDGEGYGILLYTGSPDAEGTLGGLIEVGRNIHKHLKNALQMSELCSNDPVCAYHSPENVNEKRFLLGAACHSCLLIAETSCEIQNNYLDRALVVPTVENLGAEFFRI
ncbi:MAG: DUF1998 domain-containing protein [Bacteriovoracaceae bacterium]|nr:DUF1998 domain-containing protein [Bacteriovoracaceae bacterium]